MINIIENLMWFLIGVLFQRAFASYYLHNYKIKGYTTLSDIILKGVKKLRD